MRYFSHVFVVIAIFLLLSACGGETELSAEEQQEQQEQKEFEQDLEELERCVKQKNCAKP